MKKDLHKLSERYSAERLRFGVHFAVYLVTVAILWLLCYARREELGTGWIIAITLVWSVIIIIHFALSRWKRSRFRKARH